MNGKSKPEPNHPGFIQVIPVYPSTFFYSYIVEKLGVDWRLIGSHLIMEVSIDINEHYIKISEATVDELAERYKDPDTMSYMSYLMVSNGFDLQRDVDNGTIDKRRLSLHKYYHLRHLKAISKVITGEPAYSLDKDFKFDGDLIRAYFKVPTTLKQEDMVEMYNSDIGAICYMSYFIITAFVAIGTPFKDIESEYCGHVYTKHVGAIRSIMKKE